VSRAVGRLNTLTLFLVLELPDIVNDLDIDFASNPEAAAKVQNDRRNLRKIREVVESTNINIMNPLREGKNLLVLDLDYSKHHLARWSCPQLTTFQLS